MLGKLLIAAGVAICVLGGVILAALVTGTQMTHSGYSPTVQHYADQNASAGNPVAFTILGIGAVFLIIGLALTLLRRTSR